MQAHVKLSSTRIEVDNFAIPPEFSALRLAHRSAGQIGGARIELLARAGRTLLGSCYQQVPVRIVPPFHFPDDPCALLYLLNPTAGLLDGDGQFLEIIARSGTQTVVTGQSANRVHPALSSFATQQWNIHVEKGATLVVLPGPTIPYRGSKYYQRVTIELETGADLIWGDIWLPGRYTRGELSEWYCFDQIVQEMEIRREGQLIYRERFHWQGPWTEDQTAWFCGGKRAVGNLFATGTVGKPGAAPPEIGDRAIVPLASGDTVIRWCSTPRKTTEQLVEAALCLASGSSSEQGRWLRTSCNFAPNHWFSTGVDGEMPRL